MCYPSENNYYQCGIVSSIQFTTILASMYQNSVVNCVFNYVFKLIKTISYVMMLLWLGPIFILLILDLTVYFYRLAVISFLSLVALPDFKKIRRQRRQELYHTNSYFNFSNYIKNSLQERNIGRKGSADSLDSNDSVTTLSSFDKDEGVVYLKNSRDQRQQHHQHQQQHQHQQHQQQIQNRSSRNVVFSVSN